MRDIKRSLRTTWYSFFGRFRALTEVQERTIPVVLDGCDAIVSSATASGKTEAVVAPLIERMIKERWEGTSILYVTPTRALVNDICDRLSEPLRGLDATLDVKTGDHPNIKSRRPDVLITTPESMDSLLCRRPSVLKGIRAVVIDEVHLIDNTYRGDQMRFLLRRLRSLTEFNTYMLSATLNDADDVASRYMDDWETIVVPGARDLRVTYHVTIDDVAVTTREEGLRKAIVFCNSRRRTEEVAESLKPILGENVFAHHGSLSKSYREDGESYMRNSRSAFCVATTSLEIGVDIGGVDLIVLADVPFTLSSLAQRVGRGSRRGGSVRVMAVHATQDERDMLESMFDAISDGRVEDTEYSPDASVVVQQMLSMLYAQPRGIQCEELLSRLDWFIPRIDVMAIIETLSRRGLIEGKRFIVRATTEAMDMGERGKVHSNVPDRDGVTVFDVTSRQRIGEIHLPVNGRFTLGGRGWSVIRLHGSTLEVRPCAIGGTTSFTSVHDVGAFNKYFPGDFR